VSLELVVPIVAAAVAVPVLVVLGVALWRRELDRRQRVSERLGLSYSRSSGGTHRETVLGSIRLRSRERLTGTFAGRGVRVDYPERSHGQHGSERFTRVVVEGGARPGLTFTLRREGLGTKLGKKLGLVREIEVGDEALDRAWRVQAEPEALGRSVLASPAVREELDRHPGTLAVLAREGRLEVLGRKALRDAERLEALLRHAVRLAEVLR
jgi:hypothetical protein